MVWNAGASDELLSFAVSLPPLLLLLFWQLTVPFVPILLHVAQICHSKLQIEFFCLELRYFSVQIEGCRLSRLPSDIKVYSDNNGHGEPWWMRKVEFAFSFSFTKVAEVKSPLCGEDSVLDTDGKWWLFLPTLHFSHFTCLCRMYYLVVPVIRHFDTIICCYCCLSTLAGYLWLSQVLMDASVNRITRVLRNEQGKKKR